MKKRVLGIALALVLAVTGILATSGIAMADSTPRLPKPPSPPISGGVFRFECPGFSITVYRDGSWHWGQ